MAHDSWLLHASQVNDALSGAMILGAIGLYSPMAAVHTFAGSSMGGHDPFTDTFPVSVSFFWGSCVVPFASSELSNTSRVRIQPQSRENEGTCSGRGSTDGLVWARTESEGALAECEYPLAP